jgi:hypothetical protein
MHPIVIRIKPNAEPTKRPPLLAGRTHHSRELSKGESGALRVLVRRRVPGRTNGPRRRKPTSVTPVPHLARHRPTHLAWMWRSPNENEEGGNLDRTGAMALGEAAKEILAWRAARHATERDGERWHPFPLKKRSPPLRRPVGTPASGL